MLANSLGFDQGRLRRATDLALLCGLGALVSATFFSCSSGGGGAAPAGTGDGGDGTPNPPNPATGADLMPLSIEFNPPGIAVGQSLTVSDTVRNQGSETAPPFSVSIYLSSDDEIDISDTLLGFRSIATLGPGEDSTGGGSVTIPFGTVAGTWWIGSIVDDFGQVTELDEDNNAMASLATLEIEQATQPDVHPTSVSFQPSSIEAGESIEVTDTVANNGTALATSFVVGIYLSSDAAVTTSDTLLGVRAVAALIPGAESSATGMLTVPSWTPAGTWYIGVIADTQSDLVEANELDNVAVAPTLLTITSPPLPDLSVTQFSFSPVSVNVGFPLEVSEAVANQGLGASGTFEVGIYLSGDSTIATNDRLLGFRTVVGLGAGEASSQTSSVFVPPDVAAGVYHLGAIADHLGEQDELAEANNAFTSFGLLTVVVPPMPDLEMTGISFSPSLVDLGIGDALTISETAHNSGALPTGTFRIGFYLSPDSSISSSDILIGSRLVTGLGVDESSSGVTELVLPQSVPGGSYVVGAIADDLDVVVEPSAEDNAIFATGMVEVMAAPDPMPDLVMAMLTFSPSSASPGATLQILDAVSNHGDLVAGTFHVGIYLSDDDVLTTDDMLLTERIVFDLSVDFGSAANLPVALPDTLPVGTYWIGAVADHNAVVAEHDEDNNMFVTASQLNVFAPPPPTPDLIVSSLSVSPSGLLVPGQVMQVSGTAQNAGNLDTVAVFRMAYYLSHDDEITTDDALIGFRTVSGLATGQVSESTQEFALPTSLAPGMYTLGAIVDDLDAVAESDEENNSTAATPLLEVL